MFSKIYGALLTFFLHIFVSNTVTNTNSAILLK